MINSKDLNLTVISVGMKAFEKTGIRTSFLVFNSKNLKRSWRVTLKEFKQQGVLKVKSVVAFNYFYNELDCKMERLVNGVIVEEWNIVEVMIDLRD